MIIVGLAHVTAEAAGWGHMSGWGWGWMFLGSLFWIGLIGVVAWAVFRPSSGAPKGRTPEEVLEKRFANGELSLEDFEERRAALRR